MGDVAPSPSHAVVFRCRVGAKTRQETYSEIRSSLDLLGDPFTRLLDPPQYDNIKRQPVRRGTPLGRKPAGSARCPLTGSIPPCVYR